MTSTQPRRRTLAITILAVVAVIAGANALFDMLRFLRIVPITLGDMQFFAPNINWLGALFAGLLVLIWWSTAAQLWRLDPRGWLFVVLVATLNLIFPVIALIGHSTLAAVSTGLVINGVALILGLLPSTKAAFGLPPAQPKR